MHEFLRTQIDGKKCELLIDTKIFPKDIILKSAYNFLDVGYFFFFYDDEGNMILQCSVKNEKIGIEELIWNFSDELLAVSLRDKLEKDNKIIRETIITKAINWPIDTNNFVTLDTQVQSHQNQIDFDKDIDEILKEIENDPDLKIDEDEIAKILKEIEDEAGRMDLTPQITLDTNALKDVKAKFQNRW